LGQLIAGHVTGLLAEVLRNEAIAKGNVTTKTSPVSRRPHNRRIAEDPYCRERRMRRTVR
jgi:hypothetical protein